MLRAVKWASGSQVSHQRYPATVRKRLQDVQVLRQRETISLKETRLSEATAEPQPP
ncbi:hypothetical protein NPIL_298161, partial [Nephila pilipes]